MKNFKTIFTIFIIVTALCLSVWVYRIGTEYGAQSEAYEKVALETEKLEEENKHLAERCDEYESDIEQNRSGIEKSEENTVLDDYYEKIADCEKRISTLNEEMEAAKKDESAIKNYNVDLNGISNEEKGAPQKYKDKTLLCPSDISAGRYKISGTGSFRIVTNVNNTVTESQNLSSTDNNSYTTNIEGDSKVIVEGELSFIPVN